jgi:riboflavin-specific deaminase-like protein
MNQTIQRTENSLQVTLKLAQSLDGCIATKSGESRWITSLESRTMAHELRARHDTILVGIGTVLADNPQLTVRLCAGKSPRRVVLDSQLRISAAARILTESADTTTIICTSSATRDRISAIEATGARVEVVPEADGHVSLPHVLDELRSQGSTAILVEGGAQITTSFLREHAARDIVVFIAPLIMGGGLRSVGDLQTMLVNQGIRIEGTTLRLVGPDFMISGKLLYPARGAASE